MHFNPLMTTECYQVSLKHFKTLLPFKGHIKKCSVQKSITVAIVRVNKTLWCRDVPGQYQRKNNQ